MYDIIWHGCHALPIVWISHTWIHRVVVSYPPSRPRVKRTHWQALQDDCTHLYTRREALAPRGPAGYPWLTTTPLTPFAWPWACSGLAAWWWPPAGLGASAARWVWLPRSLSPRAHHRRSATERREQRVSTYALKPSQRTALYYMCLKSYTVKKYNCVGEPFPRNRGEVTPLSKFWGLVWVLCRNAF